MFRRSAGRGRFRALITVLGLILGLLAVAPTTAQAGGNTPPLIDGSVSYSSPVAQTSCVAGVPQSVSISFSWDASQLHTSVPLTSHLALVRNGTEFFSLDDAPVQVGAGTTSSYSHTFQLPAVDLMNSSLSFTGAVPSQPGGMPNFHVVYLYGGLACGETALGSPLPTVSVSQPDCSGDFAFTFNGSNTTTAFDYYIEGTHGIGVSNTLPGGQVVVALTMDRDANGNVLPDTFEVTAGSQQGTEPFEPYFSADIGHFVVTPAAPCVPPTLPGAFVALDPARIADTRIGLGHPGRMEPDQTISLPITGQGGIPTSGVAALVANVTVTDPTAPGNLSIYPSGVTRPNASNLNFVAGQTVPNLVTVPVGADGKIQLTNSSPGFTHVIVDVAGYYLAGTPTQPGTFTSLTPHRIMDTRSNPGGTGIIGSDQTVPLQVTGQGGVPNSQVAAVVANVTVTEPGAPGNLAVYPTGVSRPNVSNLNFVAGQTVPNLVTVPLGADGKIQLTNNSTSATHVIVDVAGYYLAGTPTQPGTYKSLTPTRLVDTRYGLGVPVWAGVEPLQPDRSMTPELTGSGGLPIGGVGAIAANVTVTQPTAPGNISVYPDWSQKPTSSNLNFAAGQSVPNLVYTPIGDWGSITLSNNSTGSSHLIIDIQGYFLE